MAAWLASTSRQLVKISSTQLQPIPALSTLNCAWRLAFGRPIWPTIACIRDSSFARVKENPQESGESRHNEYRKALEAVGIVRKTRRLPEGERRENLMWRCVECLWVGWIR